MELINLLWFFVVFVCVDVKFNYIFMFEVEIFFIVKIIV